jgi:hypothetical protein
LFFSHNELERSADVFVIEMLDIKHHHRLLYGQDVFQGLTISTDRHRVQLEHDLRTKVLLLRQNYLSCATDQDKVRRLMLDSISYFSTLFRHTLITLGEQPPAGKAEVMQRLAERTGIEAGIFLQLLQVRARQMKERDIEAQAGFTKYLEAIEKVIQAVDAL